MNEEHALKSFGALSNPARLAVIRALVKAGPEGLRAGEIAAAISASPSRASFHLSGLAETGLVTTERKSREVIYRISFAQIRGLAQFLLEDCCSGAAAKNCDC